ncbi:hypothetical protein GCM10010218_49670 [Streptomyces mashuensis]|uniref:Uncharacterized protein n=1 Tax=Streptomyces mashuensis TaxID=33904 RepID=A0A919B8D9_9ACTN|nr:hypothetical protein GCM10010218_49670 [Streptomyces mashuensis]
MVSVLVSVARGGQPWIATDRLRLLSVDDQVTGAVMVGSIKTKILLDQLEASRPRAGHTRASRRLEPTSREVDYSLVVRGPK